MALIDLFLIALYLLGMAGMGFYCMRRNRDADAYFRADGLAGGLVALWLANADIGNIYNQFQRFLGVLTGGLGCLFFMGVFMKRVNGFGAICGLAANYIVCIALDRLSFAGKPHLLLYGTMGMAVCLAVAPVCSRFRRERK